MFIRQKFVQELHHNSTVKEKRWAIAHRGLPKKLFVSDLGSCPLRAKLRFDGIEPTNPFDDYVLEVMESGNVWGTYLANLFKDNPMTLAEVQVGDQIWSGRIDLLIAVDPPIVVEFKDVADYNFRAKDRLPYLHHCYQLLAYTHLLKQQWGSTEEPEAVLYYHGRASWAEFDVRQKPEGIIWYGETDKGYKDGFFENEDYREAMRQISNTVFPPEGHVVEIPHYPTPFTERFACTRNTRAGTYPSCLYCFHCWPGLKDVQSPYNPDRWIEGQYQGDTMANG